jgi:hypothetical protein
MRGKERTYCSRFQVLTEGEPAWTMDERGAVYLYDGSGFRRRGRRGDSYKLVISWQSPAYGWMHLPDCPCRACASESALEADGGQAVA